MKNTVTVYLTWVYLLALLDVIVAKETIQVAFLSPGGIHGNSNVSSSIPGMANALYDIEQTGLLTNYNLNISWYDSDCQGSKSVGYAASAIHANMADVIFGPACSEAARPVAELAAFYNIPMFTWHPSANNDKHQYKTLARLFGHQEVFGVFVTKVLGVMGWKRVVLITDETRYSLLATTVAEELRKANIYLAKESVLGAKPTKEEINRSLLSLQKYGRVYLLVVDTAHIRDFMVEAYELGMAGGDYAYVAVEQTIADIELLKAGNLWNGSDGRNEHAKATMQSLIYMSNADILSPAVNETLFKEFSDKGVRLATNWPLKHIFPPPAASADVYSPFLYDALMVYAQVVNQSSGATLAAIRNGTWVMEQLKYKQFHGEERDIVMNGNADREPVIWVMDLSQEGVLTKVAFVTPYIHNHSIYHDIARISNFVWPLGHAPLDEPECGFYGEECGYDLWFIVLVIVLSLAGVLALLMIPLGIILHNRRSIEKTLSSTLWNVAYEEIEYDLSGQNMGSRPYSLSVASLPGAFTCIASPLGTPALYRGTVVSVNHCDRKAVTLTDSIRMHLSTMRELHHSNINTFLGACLSGPVCFLWQFCSKGTMTNILHNKNIKLDYHFKVSLITDIMRGMEYLHSSPIGSHGNLTSCNVVVDARWCAKVSNFGVNWLSADTSNTGSSRMDSDRSGALFWTAPELLRCNVPPVEGSRAGDVYSFGIIVKQILTKSDPYEEYEELSDEQIVTNVRCPGPEGVFRPQLRVSGGEEEGRGRGGGEAGGSLTSALVDLVQACWHEDPLHRPSFKSLAKSSHQLLKGAPSNLMDNMLQMLEKYANNLEEIVDQRTRELMEEKKKTDKLLYNMLPQSVAEALKREKKVQAEWFDHVTIYFSDIVDFTDIASNSTPLEIVALLNALYTLFDDIITRHDVYKVETIGDAYMLVSGLPKRNGEEHVREIASCALELRSAVAQSFIVPHKPCHKLQIRIGLHSGSCVAGVVGLAMPRYCLFGDTVNTASRMESNGEAMRIHMSSVTAEALKSNHGCFHITERGLIPIKGKGKMFTYWLEDNTPADGL